MLKKAILIISSVFLFQFVTSCIFPCKPGPQENYDVTFTGTELRFTETTDKKSNLLYVSMETEQELITLNHFDFLKSMKFQTLMACSELIPMYNFGVEIVDLKVFSKLSNGEYLDVRDEFVSVDRNGDYDGEIEDSLCPISVSSTLILILDYRSEEKEIKEGDTFKVIAYLEDGSQFEHENTL